MTTLSTHLHRPLPETSGTFDALVQSILDEIKTTDALLEHERYLQEAFAALRRQRALMKTAVSALNEHTTLAAGSPWRDRTPSSPGGPSTWRVIPQGPGRLRVVWGEEGAWATVTLGGETHHVTLIQAGQVTVEGQIRGVAVAWTSGIDSQIAERAGWAGFGRRLVREVLDHLSQAGPSKASGGAR